MEIRYKLRGENHKDSPQNIKILNERTNLTSRDVLQDIHKFCYFCSERSLLPIIIKLGFKDRLAIQFYYKGIEEFGQIRSLNFD